MPRLSFVPICDICWSEIPVLSGPVCPQCADPLFSALDGSAPGASPDTPLLCRPCRLAPPPFVRAVAYGPYEGRMRDAIHALKYQGLATAARPLGRLLAKAIEQLPPGNPASDSTRESGLLVVPVPLHRAKSGQRGFNQARLLAESAIRALRISRPGWRLTLAPNSVIRLRATGSQAGLSPHQRRRNVRGAFSVPDPRAITGRHVLLIDDIFTTGATARAVARALRSAGAASVSVATLARARLLQHTLKPQPASAVTSAAHTPTASMHASTNQPSF